VTEGSHSDESAPDSFTFRPRTSSDSRTMQYTHCPQCSSLQCPLHSVANGWLLSSGTISCSETPVTLCGNLGHRHLSDHNRGYTDDNILDVCFRCPKTRVTVSACPLFAVDMAAASTARTEHNVI